MHACFHGGGGRIKSISIIRDITKNMKAMSLKVKAGGGGSYAPTRRRRQRGRRPEAEEDPQMEGKDISAAAAASTSAKIAPAQVQDADGYHAPPPSNDRRQLRKEEQVGKRRVHCDKCYSPLDDGSEKQEAAAAAAAAVGADHRVAEESDREWVAEPEPGVLMTLVSRPDGTNHLRRLRFREKLFDGARAAQRWWADNYDSIVELYSIVQSDQSHEKEGDDDDDDSAPVTPCQSEDEYHQPRQWQRQGCDSASGPSSGSGSGGGSASTLGSPILGLVLATPNTSTRERPKPSTIRQV